MSRPDPDAREPARAERFAENERVFRRANEDIWKLASQLAGGDSVPLLCECGDARCTRTLALSPGEYEEIRGDPDAFVMLPGHAALELEQVIAERPGYIVVSKPQPD